ncbi:DUF6922 domain-containing protein [Bacteroides finegoldii]|uniref:DUF6922 domain-containing protein n=2 Tax=Bacteroides finegoldii TaxID=338188 RepID=UPI001E3A00EB|nr:hypothetical protein [Bacteroides finegoldii]
MRMFFDNYKQHTDAQIRQSLFWEYDMSRFDWDKMRTLVVQRVIERGRKDDFFAILNRYGVEGVKESIKEIPTMNAKDISFVCAVFDLKKEDLKCYTRKLSHP